MIFIVIWFLVPFVMSFYSWRQHGLRYIIEIYPALAIIAALGFSVLANKFATHEYKKYLMLFLVIMYLLLNLLYIKPYYLDYFNELVGGTGTVFKYNLFQTGWWGQGIREAGLYLNNNTPKGSSIGLAISPEHTVPKSENLKYYKWEGHEDYDYVMVNHYHIIRDGFDDSDIRKKYKLIKKVGAGGAIFVYIYGKN